MRKLLASFIVLLLFGAKLSAQTTVQVTGRVLDSANAPLAGATITEKGTKKGVTAGYDGTFKITVNPRSTLVITAVGYAAQEVTASSNVSITLRRDVEVGNLNEVVVTALGVQRPSKELGFATAKIGATELTQAKVVNLQNGLTGKVSGLNVQTVNNGVFADTRITLRGIRSLTGNNQPMLIVDGVPIALGYLSTLNPNDIANVTILKSASATAIYGPDGVNGALVVTTKKGNRTKPVITLSHTVQVEKVSFMPKLQTQFGGGSSVDANGYGIYDSIENQGYGDAFDGSLRQIGRTAPDGSKYLVEYVARPEEKRKFWNTGVTNQTDVSYSTANFYLSAQNVDIKGIMPKDKNQRSSVRMSANQQYGKFRAAYSLNYTRGNYDVTNSGNRDFRPYWLLINSPMNIPITRFKNWQTDYWANPNGYFNDYYTNPYFAIDNFRGKGSSDDFVGNVELNLKATSWLNVTYRLGSTVSSASSKSTTGAFTYSQYAIASGKSIAQSGNINAAVSDNSSTSSRINSELFATADKTFGSFHVSGLLGQSFREINSKAVGVSSSNLGIPQVFNVSARRGEPGASESNSKQRLQRFYGRLAFSYNNWAFIEGTGSYDMDSRLSDPYNYKFGNIDFFYPSVNASVVLSDAIPALKDVASLSYLKVRGAYSKTGSVNLGTYNLENTFSNGSGFPYGTLLGYTANNTLYRNSYQPEFVKNAEVGIEMGFLKNRVSLEASLYKQDNSNQVITAAYSQATGYGNALLNAASFTNKGLELDLRLTPLVRLGQVNIDFKANYTYQTNKVTSLIEGINELGIGNGNFIIVNQPAYTFKLTDYVKDNQGRVIVNSATGLPSVNPVTTMFGQTQPKHILGLNLNVSWKNLSFSAVADYRGGNQIYAGNLGTAMDFSGISYRSGQNSRQPFIFPNSVYNDGTKLVPNTSVYTTGGYNFWSVAVNQDANSNYLVSGAFWKIREASLTYTFSKKALNFANNFIQSASFSLVGRNLFMFLPSTNQWTDPEFSNTTGNAQGVSDLGNTPPTRIFGANLTVQF